MHQRPVVAFELTRLMPVLVGLVLRTAFLPPQEIGALAGALLAPFQLLAPGLQNAAVGRERPAAADMRPGVQFLDGSGKNLGQVACSSGSDRPG